MGEKSAKERAFVVAVFEHMDLFGEARVRAVGRNDFGQCDSTFRVLFKLNELNVRDEEAQFLEATSCDRRPESLTRDEKGLFGPAYFSMSVTKDGKPLRLVDDTRLKVDFDTSKETAMSSAGVPVAISSGLGSLSKRSA